AMLTLESLPKENVYRILSTLSTKDRNTVRQCSKVMKEAVEESDLFVNLVTLEFDLDIKTWDDLEQDPPDNPPKLSIKLESDGWTSWHSINYTEEDEVQNYIDTMKTQFRSLRCNMLSIGTGEYNIDRTEVEEFIERIDFCSLEIRFFDCNQQSIFDFALSSGRPIEYFTGFDASIKLDMIVDLPQMKRLFVKQKEKFSDKDVLSIVEQDHYRLELSTDISDPTTIHRLIEMVRSSECMERVQVDLTLPYLNNFLSSFNLWELRDSLVDTKGHTEVIDLDYKTQRYFINFGMWYMEVERFDFSTHYTDIRSVAIYDGTFPTDRKPFYSVTPPTI
ncbi:hypothetical protein PFISCL1PPCAC_13598, partial [Pristionchus fissidentatus]